MLRRAGEAETGNPVEPDGSSFEIWEENVDSAGLFFALSTQWRVIAGRAGLIHLGLDYAAVRALIALEFDASAKKARRLMRDVMIMEQEALPLLNEVRP